MASLTGSTIAASYEQLLALPDGGLNGNTLVAITDGDSSVAIGMKVATNKIEIIPGSDDANAFEVSKADGTAVLTVNTSTVGANLIGALTVGVDDAGHDVIFYGNSASSNVTWDTSEDDLILNDARLYINQDDAERSLEIVQDGNAQAILIDQNANNISIKFESLATTSEVMKIYDPKNETAPIFNISDADALTSGNAIRVQSDSASTTARELVRIHNDNAAATGAIGLAIQQDSTTAAAIRADGGKVEFINTSLNTTGSFLGITNQIQKTAGSTDGSDNYWGMYNELQFNDADAGFGHLRGIYNEVKVAAADDTEATSILGIESSIILGDGDVNNVYGNYNLVDINSGTVVDAQVQGSVSYVDISAGTIGDDIVVQYLNLGTEVDCGGTARMLVANMNGGGLTDNADQFLYFYDDVNDDIVAQILFANTAAVATFDGGDFAGAPDYAEYFESKNGKAIPVGTTVKLDGDKVIACSEGDTPIGIVRPDGQGTSAYKAGAQNLRWQGKYISNDYNEQQNEDYTITKWTESITEEEYLARGKDETGGVSGGSVKDNKVEGSKAIPAKEAVTQQKTVDEEVEEEVTTTSLVDGKYVQKTETITKTVKVPQYNEVDLYDEDGKVIGKHQVPIIETVEEAVAGVDAVPDTYKRTHRYHSDRLPDGVTAPDDAETITPSHKRKKLNPDFDASKVDDYTKRPERDEWNLIGLLGQIPITKGQPLGDNWIKMKDVSDTVEMYFVK